MEPAGRRADAVAIGAGRILAVGSSDDVSRRIGPCTRTTDLDGRALLPAFTDTHMHLEKIAAELIMVHLGDARTLDELLATVDATASNAPARRVGAVVGGRQRMA